MTQPTDAGTSQLRVLLIEDNATVAAAMMAALRDAGMLAELAVTGEAGREAKRRFRPDVALVDLGLPDIDGFTLVEEFGNAADCGIIVVTSNDDEAARILGLETGADDYIVKPPALRELAARIRAVHRRMTRAEPTAAESSAPVTLDLSRRNLVGADGMRTALTEAEAAALDLLLGAQGASISRARISEVALKRALHEDDRSVDQLVLKLRRKLATQGLPDRLILSARREGYVIAEYDAIRRTGTLPKPAA